MFLLRVLFLPFSVCVSECLSLIRMHVSFKGIVDHIFQGFVFIVSNQEVRKDVSLCKNG